jgi:hypothetical protein
MKDSKQAYNAAYIILTAEGLSPLEIQDVLNAGKQKYEHPAFSIYKQTNKALLEWLDNDNTYDVIASLT